MSNVYISHAIIKWRSLVAVKVHSDFERKEIKS